MAWVQVGTHKINTALICYVEQEGETVRMYFHGEWEGNPLDLHFDEAKAFWKHLKAEDVLMVRDKGSAAVMPKLRAAGMYDVHANAGAAPAEKPKPAVTVTTGSGSTSGSSSQSSSHSHSHSHSPKHSDKHGHSEHKKH